MILSKKDSKKVVYVCNNGIRNKGDGDNGSATSTPKRSSSRQGGFERFDKNRHQGASAILRPDGTR